MEEKWKWEWKFFGERNSGFFDNYFRNNIEVFVYTVEKETKRINIFICKRVERVIS